MTSKEIRQSFLDFFKGKDHSIVPSSSLLPDSPNLLFTNAGMNQFVPVFTGAQKPAADRIPGALPGRPTRAADTQKCIRAGGKHNDLDDVGLDTYHHTFFEMLGNWSFGDYFKKEAIEWAWELLVDVWGFPPERLYATVYAPQSGDPGEFDKEAQTHWARLFQSAKLDPTTHIVPGSHKDNFWMMGETGPCGPCSEVHVDLTSDGRTGGKLVNVGDPRCIEIWNLVFIQFNANPDGSFTPLPARHVDTGMGFERVTSVIQGTNQFKNFHNARISNYETDIFRPIFDKISELSGRRYGSSSPAAGSSGATVQERDDIAFRVIADHIRTLTFAIADGILPGNTDRNYVLRRILRRAVRYGRTLGLREPFFYKLVEVLTLNMGSIFPEIRNGATKVAAVLKTEEESFNRTLDKGIALFEEEAGRLAQTGTAILSGTFAFRLYDEQGFPLDLTQVMARERGLEVDEKGFDVLMAQQRDRARKAQKKKVIELSDIKAPASRFVGYDRLECETTVLEVLEIKGRLAAVCESTPFYAEMGGQVGDSGLLFYSNISCEVHDTTRVADATLHLIGGDEPLEPGSEVRLAVDRERRAAIQRNHTATHLLHWALREVAGLDVSQKGSFVGPEKLSFDFNSQPLDDAQLREIEHLVNLRILENAPVHWRDYPYTEVCHRPDVMQFFGEKYGSTVRVVQIGGDFGALDGFSMELCGGTHTRATGEIGLFRILTESAVAAGIRRIEATTGLVTARLLASESARLASLAKRLGTPLVDLETRIENLLAHEKELERALEIARRREAGLMALSLLEKRAKFGSIEAVVARLDDCDGDQLAFVAEVLTSKLNGPVTLFASEASGVVSIVCMIPKELTSKLNAGAMVREIAPLLGGKGGGRPDFARGAGRDASGIGAAIKRTEQILSSMMNV